MGAHANPLSIGLFIAVVAATVATTWLSARGTRSRGAFYSADGNLSAFLGVTGLKSAPFDERPNELYQLLVFGASAVARQESIQVEVDQRATRRRIRPVLHGHAPRGLIVDQVPRVAARTCIKTPAAHLIAPFYFVSRLGKPRDRTRLLGCLA